MATQVDFSGKTFCVLTGASQGIGRALATEVAKILEPSSVMLLLARNAEQLAETASLCQAYCQGIEVTYQSVDLSNATAQQMYDLINNSIKGHKISDFKTSIIFHNVGSLGNVAIKTSNMEDIADMRSYYDLNVFNVITLNTQFLKIFEEIESNLVIVNITSLCAIKPMTGMAYYCSGKAAREMYFKVLAEENKNLRILNYSPGPVETTMIDYIIQETVNEELKNVFTGFKSLGTLLKPDMTAAKCVHVLIAGKYASGDHVDYFEVKE